MPLERWIKFVHDAGLIDEGSFTTRKARVAFVLSRMRASDEIKRRDTDQTITDTDMLEAFARVASVKWLPTDEQMEEEAGIWDGDVVEYFAEGHHAAHVSDRIETAWDNVKTLSRVAAPTTSAFEAAAARVHKAVSSRDLTRADDASGDDEDRDDDDDDGEAGRRRELSHTMALPERLDKLLKLTRGGLAAHKRAVAAEKGGMLR